MTTPLSILHVLRAPTGGLFRHVRDLALAQTAAGHRVGIVADSMTGGETADRDLAALDGALAHGVTRLPIPRTGGWGDWAALRHVKDRARGADVLHGHGAKGGLYARLAARRVATGATGAAVSAYTPHGGTLNFDPASASGRLYHGAERLLIGRTDAVLFESAHAERAYTRMIGRPPPASRVVVNGLADADFADIPLQPDAADFVFIGELRDIKGVDVALRALAGLELAGLDAAPRLALIGDGPDEARLRGLAAELGLEGRAVFHGRHPAPYAFARGRCVLVPSRAESMPYVVLEAVAAARPLVATRVGGIPEIVPEGQLVPAGDVAALQAAMAAQLADPEGAAAAARARREDVRTRFSAARMAEEIEAVYRAALARAPA